MELVNSTAGSDGESEYAVEVGVVRSQSRRMYPAVGVADVAAGAVVEGGGVDWEFGGVETGTE